MEGLACQMRKVQWIFSSLTSLHLRIYGIFMEKLMKCGWMSEVNSTLAEWLDPQVGDQGCEV